MNADMPDTRDQANLLYILQVAGASFPTGAFSHSLGFETLVDDGSVASVADLATIAGDWLELGLGPVDGAAVALGYAAGLADADDAGELLVIDELLGALKPAREPYEASVKMGAALRRAAESIGGGPALARYAAAVSGGRAEGHAALSFALACLDAGVPRTATVLAYLQSGFANLILVVARLIPLGQFETQRVIADAIPSLIMATERALAARLDDLAGATPLLDVAAMRHERLSPRLCIS